MREISDHDYLLEWDTTVKSYDIPLAESGKLERTQDRRGSVISGISEIPLDRRIDRFEEEMKKIVEGIHSFQSSDFQEHQEFFQSLAQGQSPRALFITCSDSRIAPNRLTQTKPGELFIRRTAGNIVPPYGAVDGGEAATIEYAIAALEIKSVIICGHSHCGAMSGLLSLDKLDNLPAVRSYLRHADATRRIMDENYSHIDDFSKRLYCTVEENVLVQLDNLRTHPTVAAAIARKDLELHGWVYRFETGEVFSFDPDKRDFTLLTDIKPAITDALRPSSGS